MKTKVKRVKSIDPYRIKRSKFFTTKEREQILKVTEAKADIEHERGNVVAPRRWMLVHLAFFSGLRVSEIVSLRIRDINLNESPYIAVQCGKRGKSRDVYIDSHLADHLREFIDYRHPDRYLFEKSGKRMTANGLHVSFKTAIREANLRTDLSVHSARHTYATYALMKTGNIRFIQKQLGHASLNMTSLYADVIPEQNTKLAQMILLN